MSRGRPRTVIGTFGQIAVSDIGGRPYRAVTRYRDIDGRLRKVEATASSPRTAEALLKERLLHRRGYGAGGVFSMSSPFGDLVELWLADLDLRDIAENTKGNYRDDLRLHVRPFFEHFTLGEITTGRVGSWGGGTAAMVGFTVALIVFAVGETLLAPSQASLVNDLAPDDLRGRYNGLYTLAWTTGLAVGPAVAGVALAGGHGSALFVGLAVACGITAIAARRLGRRLPASVDVVVSVR